MTEATYVLKSPVPFACHKSVGESFTWPVPAYLAEAIQHSLDVEDQVNCLMLEQGHFYTMWATVTSVSGCFVELHVKYNSLYGKPSVVVIEGTPDFLPDHVAQGIFKMMM